VRRPSNAIRRFIVVGAALAIAMACAPALAVASASPDITFTIDPFPVDNTVRFVPSTDTAAAMSSGSELVWDWGDGTYCVTNPDPESGYLPDPNSSCSDPSDVHHTYPSVPKLYYQYFVITLGAGPVPSRSFYYSAIDGPSPYGPFPYSPWSNLTVYDDQHAALDLSPFTTRYNPADLATVVQQATVAPWPFHGAAIIDRSGRLSLTPDGTGHGIETVVVDFQPFDLSGSGLFVNIAVEAHTLAQIPRTACGRRANPRTHRFRCTIAEHSADRRGTSTRFRTNVVSVATRAKHMSARTALAGGSTRTVIAWLRRGAYQVRVVNADGRVTVHRLRAGVSSDRA
jgi:hypothetical protein